MKQNFFVSEKKEQKKIERKLHSKENDLEWDIKWSEYELSMHNNDVNEKIHIFRLVKNCMNKILCE